MIAEGFKLAFLFVGKLWPAVAPCRVVAHGKGYQASAFSNKALRCILRMVR